MARTFSSPVPSIPPEWARHKCIWTAWPSHPDLWGEDLEAAREEVAALVFALSAGETVKVLACNGREHIEAAKEMLGEDAEIVPLPFGDIWLRDTGPVFGFEDSEVRRDEDKSEKERPRDGAHSRTPTAHVFRFNGWGGKYVLQNDDGVAAALAKLSGAKALVHDFILEGGAIETDGGGLLLTTRQCLLNPNRNPEWAGSEAQAEAALIKALGARKILWLDHGLLEDHTDGHVDNLARFVAPGTVVCQTPSGDDDPNAALLHAVQTALEKMSDAEGKPLSVIPVPGPGRVERDDGIPAAASHMNFVIGNACVAVPAYNDRAEDAVAALAPLFPGRKVIALSSEAILTGGGSFHCITQPEPE